MDSLSVHDAVAVLGRLRYLLIALAGLGLVLLLLWAVVVVPPRLLDTSQIPDPAQRLDEVNGLRTNLLGVLAGLTVIAGAVVGALNFRETQRQNRAIQEQNQAILEETQRQNRAIQEQNQAILDLQRRGQVTERFTRAIDQLGQQGPEKLDVRIGAVYALEQIARDSDELHWPIMEVLTAYLRVHARAGPDVEKSADTEQWLPADQQAIATVIGRRQRERDPAGKWLNLHRTRLSGVGWSEAHLERADLYGAHLERAALIRAHLERARLDGARLEGADLYGAHLEGADLPGAHLERASLLGAHLEGADLFGAHLEGANLYGANLLGAKRLTVGQLQAARGVALARLPAELPSELARPGPADEGGSEASPGQD